MHNRSRAQATTRSKRSQVSVACVPCQSRKCRCDGERPVCSTCLRLGKTCKYNRPEGFSPYDHLKKEVEELTREIEELRITNDTLRKFFSAHATIINMLRYSSDNEAAGLLAHLRIGDSIDVILCHHASMVCLDACDVSCMDKMTEKLQSVSKH